MTRLELREHLQTYARTGVISDPLLTCFDQHGLWRGGSVRNPDPTLHAALKKIRKAVLPVSRRTKAGRCGRVLLTSFYRCGDEPLTLTFGEIRGNLILRGNGPVDAPNIREIGGHFSADTTQSLCLPQLTTVRGGFVAAKGLRLSANRLCEVGGKLVVAGRIPPRILTVGGRLEAYWVFDFRADQLLHVGGALVAPKAEQVLAPRLVSVGGGILLGNLARRLHAPSLRSVGGDLLAASVTDTHVPRLRTIGGDMDTRSALEYYHAHVRVGGDWRFCPSALAYWTCREAARRSIHEAATPLIL